MSRLLLEGDSSDRIVLQAPRGGALVLTALASLALIGIRWLFPAAWIAQGMVALFALVAVSSTLRRHRLSLDIDRRRYRYDHGWWFSAPVRQGSFDDVVGVFLDRNEGEGGLEVSRLRSRILRLRFRGWDDHEGIFPLGFPMGPRIAQEQAVDYARRLGVALVDRTEL